MLWLCCSNDFSLSCQFIATPIAKTKSVTHTLKLFDLANVMWNWSWNSVQHNTRNTSFARKFWIHRPVKHLKRSGRRLNFHFLKMREDFAWWQQGGLLKNWHLLYTPFAHNAHSNEWEVAEEMLHDLFTVQTWQSWAFVSEVHEGLTRSLLTYNSCTAALNTVQYSNPVETPLGSADADTSSHTALLSSTLSIQAELQPVTHFHERADLWLLVNHSALFWLAGPLHTDATTLSKDHRKHVSLPCTLFSVLGKHYQLASQTTSTCPLISFCNMESQHSFSCDFLVTFNCTHITDFLCITFELCLVQIHFQCVIN